MTFLQTSIIWCIVLYGLGYLVSTKIGISELERKGVVTGYNIGFAVCLLWGLMLATFIYYLDL